MIKQHVRHPPGHPPPSQSQAAVSGEGTKGEGGGGWTKADSLIGLHPFNKQNNQLYFDIVTCASKVVWKGFDE